jgi:hypothetical protein
MIKRDTAEWLFIFLMVTALGILSLMNSDFESTDNPFGIIGWCLLAYAGYIFYEKLMMKL